jgi:hypothetical protein
MVSPQMALNGTSAKRARRTFKCGDPRPACPVEQGIARIFGSPVAAQNNGVFERCICPLGTACHMMAVRLRGKAGGLTRETIRSKFRSVNMTVGKPNTTPAQELRSFVHSCTLLSLSQLVEPGQSTADWEADRASLVQQRVCLAHYHPSFTDKFLERKLKSPGAKFILAHKTSPLGHDESEARLKDGSIVYAKGHIHT